MRTLTNYKRLLSMFLCLAFIGAFALPAFAGSWSTPVYVQGQSTWDGIWPDISDDGNTCVFLGIENTYNDLDYELSIKVMAKTNNSWNEPVTLANNGIKNDIPIVHTHPAISGDGNTIIYLGCSPDNENRIYAIERQDDNSWGTPYIIDAIPTGWFGKYISIDYNGDTFAYICGDGDGAFGGTSTLYVSEKVNGEWQAGQKVSNHDGDLAGAASVPSLSADGTDLAWLQACSQFEVLTAEKTGSSWTEATVLTQSDESETLPAISGDGNTIVFFRNYVEGSTVTGKDLFAIKKVNGQWQEAVKLNSTLESVVFSEDVPPAVDSTGNRVIYTTYEKDNDDCICSGHLMITEYQSESWSTPTVLTSSDWLYHSHPKLTPDGKDLIFKGESCLMYMYTDSEPPQNPEEIPQAPSIPGNLRQISSSATAITIAWDASSSSTGIEEYIVEMKTGSGEFVEQGTTDSNTCQFSCNELSPNSTYTFRVRAMEASGSGAVSDWSQELTLTTPAAQLWNEPFTEKLNQALDKIWTVKFSLPVDPATISDNIYVAADLYGQDKIDTVIPQISTADTCEVKINPPDGGWNSNNSYYIFITEQVSSTSSSSLSENIRFQFTTAP